MRKYTVWMGFFLALAFILIFPQISSNEGSLSAIEVENQYDIVIKNVSIYDGSSGKPFKGDIGIKDGRLSA